MTIAVAPPPPQLVTVKFSRRPTRNAPGCRSAFTLLELLVVVAIIAILAAIALPVASRFLESGKEATTASRLRQVHTLQMAYAADNNGRMTAFYTSAAPVTWQEKLLPYLSIINKAGAKEDPRLVLNSPYQKIQGGKPVWQEGRSFGLNNFMASDKWSFNVARVERPSSIIMAGDMEQGNSDYMHTSDGKNHQGNTQAWGLPAYRHKGQTKAMMVFMDGHTELLDKDALKLEPAVGASLWKWWQ